MFYVSASPTSAHPRSSSLPEEYCVEFAFATRDEAQRLHDLLQETVEWSCDTIGADPED